MKKVNQYSFLAKATLSTVLALSLTLGACNQLQDRVDPASDPDDVAAEQMSESDQAINDALNVVEDGLDGNFDALGNGRIEACGTIRLDRQQRTCVIDFGTGCEGPFGRRRSGQISISYTDNQRTVNFQNYSAERITLSGTVVTNVTGRSNTGLTYNLTSSNLQVAAETWRIAFSSIQRRTEVQFGGTNRRLSDGTSTVTGTSAGTNTAGQAVRSEITTPVVYQGACSKQRIFYAVSGVIQLRNGDRPAVTLNYGTGACDKQVTVTVGTQTRIVTLQ
ncbi:MAG: hypothetical protein MUC97_04570 [Bernardetiaceae bacterium]|jgi:hypothetical protein|nr:hypothetical protein [Bernardetiaceae bacterium]